MYVKFSEPCTSFGCLKLRRFHSKEALDPEKRPNFFLKYYIPDNICEENNYDYRSLLFSQPEMKIDNNNGKSFTISLLLPNVKKIEPCYTRTLFFLPHMKSEIEITDRINSTTIEAKENFQFDFSTEEVLK